jgi:DNA polymerase III delta prime subunit
MVGFEGIHSSIAELLENFVKYPETLSHLLFVGPPGSGKTTTANAFVEAMYGKRKHYTGRALFLNSSDERSLESVRSKVYPFANSQIYTIFEELSGSKKPKIIIFDEAETLTEQAQTALRPLLDKPANEVLIFFLCNSVSKIHSSILHRFLRITFETPTPQQFRNRLEPILEKTHVQWKEQQIKQYVQGIPDVDIQFRRGDIRYFILQSTREKECQKLFDTLLNADPKTKRQYLEEKLQYSTYSELLSQVLFFFHSMGTLSVSDIHSITFFGDSDILRIRKRSEFLEDILEWIQKQLEKLEQGFKEPEAIQTI